MRRGTYISKCRRIFLWTNEQDHMRVFVHFPTAASLSEPLALLQATLTALEVKLVGEKCEGSVTLWLLLRL